MNRIASCAKCVVCLQILVLAVWASLHRSRILVVQSYDPGYAWTREVDRGVDAVLQGRNDVSVRRIYLDTKRHPWDDHKEAAGMQARRIATLWRPDAVIAVDDDAQRFVSSRIAAPAQPVVFAGVNADPLVYGLSGVAYASGVVERQPLAAMRDALLQLRIAGRPGPAPLRIAFLGDRSSTVVSDESRISAFDWSPCRLVASSLVGTRAEWDQAIDRAGAEADVLLLSNYRQIVAEAGSSSVVAAGDLIAATVARARLPVIGLNAFFVGDGGALAIATDPYVQGGRAAAIALQVVAGRQAGDIPIESPTDFVVAMHASRLAQAGIRLPEVYAAAARAAGLFTP